jgi:hypothetical protein
MATQIVSALFDDYSAATRAIERLRLAGFADSDISLVGGDAAMRTSQPATSVPATGTDDDTSGAATGATAGGAIGAGAGLLAGLGIMAIPGLGPVVAAGWLASTLLGLGTGAVAGGILGALTDAGIDESEAHVYAEGLRRGSTLVTVRAGDMNRDSAIRILDEEGRVDVAQRGQQWRDEGWSGYRDMPEGARTDVEIEDARRRASRSTV